MPEQVAEGLDPEVRGQRRVGQHQVQRVHGELGDEALEAPFAADDLDAVGRAQGRLEQVVNDEFGQRIGDADHELGAPRSLLAAQYVE